VAAFFWGSVILLAVLMLTGKIGGYVICPIASVLIYRYYFNLIGKIDVIYSYHAVIRAVAGLALGIFVGFSAQFLWGHIFEKDSERKNHIRYILYVLANLALTGVVIYTNFGRRSKIDFLVIGVYAVAVLALFVTRIPIGEKKKALFSRLSGITYPVYLFQMPIIEMLFWVMALISK
jgi:peptidoglycan/LPS O-acetylase OafA/YrhL